MPDEFPTLEAVAALGVLVVLIRTLFLYRAAVGVTRLHRSVLARLKRGETTEALDLCEDSRIVGYPQYALTMLAAAEQKPADAEEARHHVQAASDAALAGLNRHLQSGRARDLVALAVLTGAIVYVRLSSLVVSTWFYGLAAVGALLIAYGFFARRTVITALLRAAPELVTAVLEASPAHAAPTTPGACPVCYGTDCLVVERPEQVRLEGFGALGLSALSVCSTCGFVQGQADDPSSLAKLSEPGLVAASTRSSAAEEEGDEGEEHEG